jgi:hypothetical protein
MLDSDVIEIALGLIIVFVLFSLLVSAANEVLVGLMGSRSKTLWHGVERMLGSGVAKQVFDHALIRSVTPPSSWSRSSEKVFGAGSRRGPSYLEARTFATALLDVLQTPHASIGAIESELTRTLAELGRGDSSGLPRLSTALGTANQQLPKTAFGDAIRLEMAPLQQAIATQGATAAQVQAAAALVLQNLPTHVRTALSEKAAALSTDLGRSVKALADNTAGGIDDLRREIERWFDESMNAVSGWYKRWTMWVQMIIGLALAIALNVDTVRIAQELDRNDTLRKALAARADAYARNESPAPRRVTAEREPTGTLDASIASFDWKTFSVRLPADVLALDDPKVSVTPSEELTKVKVTCDPASLRALPDAKEQPAPATLTCRVGADTVDKPVKGTLTIVVASDDAKAGAAPPTAVLPVVLAPDPESQFKDIEDRLGKLGLPIGWDAASAAHPEATGISLLVKVLTWSTAFGWLLTALAGSLGAPFWFDLLKQVSNLRAAGPNPAEKKTA